LKECLDIVLTLYNNYKHSSTKFTPNEVFFSKSDDLYKLVLNNIKIVLNM
jgi:hypothetical protein